MNVKKRRLGLVFFVVANMGRTTVNMGKETCAQAFLFAFCTALSVRGYVEWPRNPPRRCDEVRSGARAGDA